MGTYHGHGGAEMSDYVIIAFAAGFVLGFVLGPVICYFLLNNRGWR